MHCSAFGANCSRPWTLPSELQFDKVSTNKASLDRLLTRFRNATSIAVVGSSGNLRCRGYGQEIDNHSVIIRVNLGVLTAGLEEDVGGTRPCDQQILVGWSMSLQQVEKIGAMCRGMHVVSSTDPIRWDIPGPKVRSVADDNQTIIDGNWIKKVAVSMLGAEGSKWPSTGFAAMVLALSIGQHINATVDVYGMGSCEQCNKFYACLPQYDERAEQDGIDGFRHLFGKEDQVRAQWVRDGVISLRQDECPAPQCLYPNMSYPSWNTVTVHGVGIPKMLLDESDDSEHQM